MAGGYAVDLGALAAAARGVRDTVDRVAIDPRLDHLGAAAGHDQLTHALGDFGVRWKRGVDALTEDGREIADRLGQVETHYREAESRTAPSFDGMVRGSGPDPGGA